MRNSSYLDEIDVRLMLQFVKFRDFFEKTDIELLQTFAGYSDEKGGLSGSLKEYTPLP